jgi:predicted nucleic acid-binding protein
MRFLLDTYVISEFVRPKPEQKVINWLDAINEENLFISVATIGEIQHGVDKLPSSSRKNELIAWLNKDLINRFDQRIIPIDVSVMTVWGALMARSEQQGKRMSVMDGMIAATAYKENLTLVTRNVDDFETCGLRLVNPWD